MTHFPIYILNPFDWSKVPNNLFSGCLDIRDIHLTKHYMVTVDGEKQKVIIELQSYSGTLKPLLEKHGKLWLFVQYRGEVQVYRDIEEKHIKFQKPPKPRIKTFWEKVASFFGIYIKPKPIPKEELTTIEIPLNQSIIGRIATL